MFIGAQFPLADLRSFVADVSGRLSRPTWPNPTPFVEFVRGFGQVRPRVRGGADGIGEEFYCDVQNLVRFQNRLRLQYWGLPDAGIVPVAVARRLLSDGDVVARLELGFRSIGFTEQITGSECLAIIKDCLSLPVQLRSPDRKSVSLKLVGLGNILAQYYLQATTEHSKIKGESAAPWWMLPGEPLVFVEYHPWELESLPRYAIGAGFLPGGDSTVKVQYVASSGKYEQKRAEYSQEHRVSYCRLQYNQRALGIWFVDTGHSNKHTVLRQMRLMLFRLHAERECLKQVLRMVTQGKIRFEHHSTSSERLQQYLNKSTRLLMNKTAYGLPEMPEFLRKIEGIVAPGERATLLAHLQGIRKNLFDKVRKIIDDNDQNTFPKKIHIVGDANTIIFAHTVTGDANMTQYQINFGNNVNFHGDFVVANTIQNSFNRATASDASEEIKRELSDLARHVAEMTKALPPDKARAAARDLETFTNEAIAKSPRREWYQLSGKGLIEAANTIAEIGAPVVKAVKTLFTLLA